MVSFAGGGGVTTRDEGKKMKVERVGMSIVVNMELPMDNIENVFCGNSALLISYPYFGAKKGTGELYRGQCKETAVFILLPSVVYANKPEFEQSRGCFGCCAKSQPVIAVDEPSKGLRIQGKLVRKPSMSDDFWSTSTCDLEVSTVQSHRSMSSISISNQSLSQQSGTGNASNNNEFINHGYLLWNQTRLQWLASKNPENGRVVEEPMLK
ncbi:hypothetical protein H5410_035406 [Solanum commersonii]|uniref:Gag1-like clamp domain-containing protein n=1 Tax=Solanum commersonii TaxID=4109 RepID=A0A9J5Y522_SOLCO|nr:hypothetical protein H5410_035406 [Solanum commersonii]